MLEKLEKQKCDRTLHRKKQQKERSPAPIYPHTELAPTSQQQLSQARIKGGGTIGRAGYTKIKGGAQRLKTLNSSQVRKLRCPVSNNRTRSSPNL
ncbi:hypothetical protein [Tychonema sp. LEGE 06208]|uniref:hypothetical protein n=1 Tax=Tychonema sp. LEGE 06208 TaxID=1828663 RepID=UPI0018815520|nr:hypothetical protein [Tychonema sp. LEGE 06208]MBE9165053.1 hypothetical protein [Tychonema sp. LEGE 06208]